MVSFNENNRMQPPSFASFILFACILTAQGLLVFYGLHLEYTSESGRILFWSKTIAIFFYAGLPPMLYFLFALIANTSGVRFLSSLLIFFTTFASLFCGWIILSNSEWTQSLSHLLSGGDTVALFFLMSVLNLIAYFAGILFRAIISREFHRKNDR